MSLSVVKNSLSLLRSLLPQLRKAFLSPSLTLGNGKKLLPNNQEALSNNQKAPPNNQKAPSDNQKASPDNPKAPPTAVQPILFSVSSSASHPSATRLLQPPFPAHLLLQPPFSLCTTSSTAPFSSLSSAPLDALRDPLPESSSTCQSPTAASKSEMDSLWPLRM